eukprot:TRINITY_DN5664_c0_g1_i1.p1 TRINITY_DN5664_c0_g1~~TRINITY_DN5664_c0_g1_i1.p1  ORF type:complete len:176 (-),score=46.09 TRINITY_DN5664_c0_g1_i1:65-592(-)
MNRPVIIKGVAKKWKAYEQWTDDYLREKLGKTEVEVTLSHNDDFVFYGTQMRLAKMTFGEFLDQYQTKNTTRKMYLAQHALKLLGDTVRDLSLPKWTNFLNLQMSNMWMGAGEQLTHLHFDNHENLLCMIDGAKELILFDPAQSNFIYPIEKDRNSALLSRIKDFDNVDLEKYPL